MKNKILFLVLVCLTVIGCKKKYCIYGRMDLRYQYTLNHSSKSTVTYYLDYNYSDLKNVIWTQDSKRRLDSLISKEGYFIDTSLTTHEFGYRYRVDENCQYCDYYKSINISNYCEQQE